MKVLHQLALSAAMAAMLTFAAAEADAQQRATGGPRTSLTRANGGGVPVHRGGRGFHRGFGFHRSFHGGFPIFWDDRETVYVVEREIIREVPAAPPPPPEPPPEPQALRPRRQLRLAARRLHEDDRGRRLLLLLRRRMVPASGQAIPGGGATVVGFPCPTAC